MEDKKRTMSRLLRLPRNFANETKKPMSPIIEKILNSKLVRTLAGNASKVSRGKPVWDSVEMPPHAAAATFQDRIVRHRSPLHQSISNNGKEEAKSQSPFVRSKSPGALGREARPSIVARSLSFKTEERAAKRKEFYERLEQKSKIMMSEKEKLQEQAKGKARSDLNRKSESSKTSINVMKKVSTALPCSPTFGRKTPSKSQDNSSRLQDNNSQSPWRRSTLACSSAGMKTPSELQDNISRSPWKYTTHPSSTIADRKTPSKLQDNNSRSPWRHTTTLPSSSSVDRKTPSKLLDNNSRSPWRHTTTLPSSSNVDRKTPSRVQDNNSRPPWRLASKSKCNKETIEMNNRSPYHLERSVSKKSTHENSSPNIQV
ncbi:hypothetical protein Leryth_018679 [Lithospermum erythrorhizon]|nr:hypothetical protein Leryth_018679 [Lithospermum erythrorhizon]